MFVLGTAGHVDHGKSTFLRHLTGEEPDRLPEEKKRGMTIDLNFVSFLSSRGERVGIVDVPGHQRFVKNMVSGCQAMDAFLFVVAADDGWMPQSEEHLQILRFLGVRHGIVIITKTDLVNNERLAEVTEDLEERFYITFSRNVEICSFSPKVPTLMGQIKEKLEDLLSSLPAPIEGKVARLWVDRSFVRRGVGVVVTGTLKEGSIAVGHELTLLPCRKKALVKSIQCYRESVGVAVPNSRVGLVLSRVELTDVERGILLVGGTPLACPHLVDALVEFNTVVPKRNLELTLQIGTLRAQVELYPVNSISSRSSVMRVKLGGRLALRTGERFVLRTPGEEMTLGGGIVLGDSGGISFRMAKGLYRSDLSEIENFICYEGVKNPMLSLAELDGKSVYLKEKIREVVEQKFVEIKRELFLPSELLKKQKDEIFERVNRGEFQEGRSKERLSCTPEVMRVVVELLIEEGKLVRGPNGLGLPGVKKPSMDREKITEGLSKFRLGIPASKNEVGMDSKLLWALAREGHLISLGEDHFVESVSYERAKGVVKNFLTAKGSASTSEMRLLLELSRKHTVMLLEKMDRDRLTYLKDGVRRLLTP